MFFWLASLAFLGSFWIGEHTLAERFLGTRLGERLQLTAAPLARLNAGGWRSTPCSVR